MYGAKEILLESDKESKNSLSDEKLLKEIERKNITIGEGKNKISRPKKRI